MWLYPEPKPKLWFKSEPEPKMIISALQHWTFYISVSAWWNFLKSFCFRFNCLNAVCFKLCSIYRVKDGLDQWRGAAHGPRPPHAGTFCQVSLLQLLSVVSARGGGGLRCGWQPSAALRQRQLQEESFEKRKNWQSYYLSLPHTKLLFFLTQKIKSLPDMIPRCESGPCSYLCMFYTFLSFPTLTPISPKYLLFCCCCFCRFSYTVAAKPVIWFRKNVIEPNRGEPQPWYHR